MLRIVLIMFVGLMSRSAFSATKACVPSDLFHRVSKSELIFLGKAVQAPGYLGTLPDDPFGMWKDPNKIAVVQVDGVTAFGDFLKNFVGSQINFRTDNAAQLSGDQFYFFATSFDAYFGIYVGFIESKTPLLAKTYPNLGKDLNDIKVYLSDTDLYRRVSQASVVAKARVLSIENMESGLPSESNPIWFRANVEVEAQFKGPPSKKVEVWFKSSTSVRWVNAPKLFVGEEAVLALQPSSGGDMWGLPAGALTVEDPLDVNDLNLAGKIAGFVSHAPVPPCQ